MKPRLVRDDELEIRPVTQRHALPVRQIEAIMTKPEYWMGAGFTRALLDPKGRGVMLCAQIAAALAEGKALADIPQFSQWRAGCGA